MLDFKLFEVAGWGFLIFNLKWLKTVFFIFNFKLFEAAAGYAGRKAKIIHSHGSRG